MPSESDSDTSWWQNAPLRLVLALACACGGARPTGPDGAASLTVITAGAEPRRIVRYEPAMLASERMELTMKLRTATTVENTVMESGRGATDVPGLKLIGQLEVTSIDAAGASVSFVIEDLVVLEDVADPKLRAKLHAATSAMKGVHASWRTTSAGEIHDLHVADAVPAVQEQFATLQDGLEEAAVIFPLVPIGTGARWRIAKRLEIAGVAWDRSVTYQLRELTDDTAVVAATVELRAESQALRTEPNATVRLTAGTGSGTRDITVPLRGLVVTGVARSTTESSYLIAHRHERLRSTVQTESSFSIKPLGISVPPEVTVSPAAD